MADPLLQETSKASPFLMLDRYAKLSLAFYLLLMVIRFAVLDRQSQTLFDTYLAEPFLLGTLALMMGRRIYLSSDPSYSSQDLRPGCRLACCTWATQTSSPQISSCSATFSLCCTPLPSL